MDVGANAAPEASEDLVTIEGDAGQTIVPVVHEDGSVQVVTVIDTEDSASSYDFGFDSGEGSSIQLLPNGGALLVGADGGFLAAAAPAWAFDAQGEPVPTWYEASGSTLTQVVDHTSGDFAYPIVADPWIGMNLFQWITVDTYSGQPRVNLKPTAWGITVWTGLAQGGGAAAFAAGQAILNTAGWDEAWNWNSTVRSALNKTSQRQQFECHALGGALDIAGGVTWNLEKFRVNRTTHWSAGVAIHRCNWNTATLY